MTLKVAIVSSLSAALGAGWSAGDAWTVSPSTPAEPTAVSAVEAVRVRALADAEAIEPGGATFHLAFVFDIEKNWHVYWKNPGEGAAPIEIRVSAPPGYEVGPIRWPRPLVIPGPMGDSYGYENQVVLFVPVKTPESISGDGASFAAELAWAVCWEVCRFGTAQKSISIPTRNTRSEPGPPMSLDPLIAAHAQRLPQPLDERADSFVEFDGRTLSIVGPGHGKSSVSFFPDHSPGVRNGPVKARVVDDRFVIETEIEMNPNNSLGQPMRLGGLVALGEEPDDPCYEFSLPATPEGPSAHP